MALLGGASDIRIRRRICGGGREVERRLGAVKGGERGISDEWGFRCGHFSQAQVARVVFEERRAVGDGECTGRVWLPVM